MPGFTLIVPFFRNCAMLELQAKAWADYPGDVRVIVVDDGSPEPAAPIVAGSRAEVYRVIPNIPWNRGGARNLGATVASTDWIVHVDVDHLLKAPAARALLAFEPQAGAWYRFPRYRNGPADETRRKDKIPEDATYGRIHPHIDSYLIERSLFWRVGGYDEDYSGCLGGGTPFLKSLERVSPVQMLPDEISLEVFTRASCPDASDFSLSRDPAEFTRRRKDKEARGDTKPRNPLRFPWERVA
jgi:glycosyltransferase involved in cell wall biosynthesis